WPPIPPKGSGRPGVAEAALCPPQMFEPPRLAGAALYGLVVPLEVQVLHEGDLVGEDRDLEEAVVGGAVGVDDHRAVGLEEDGDLGLRGNGEIAGDGG